MTSTSDMNEHLTERFSRGNAVRKPHLNSAFTNRPPMTLNLSIREYVKAADLPVDQSHWTGFREIPSSKEVFDQGRTEHDTTLELPENIVVGPYPSKEDYLERHYSLLREDAVAPLRDVISEIQVYPRIMEKDSENGAYIYEKVRHNKPQDTVDYLSQAGIHYRPHFCQCGHRCSHHLLLETYWEKGKLGAI